MIQQVRNNFCLNGERRKVESLKTNLVACSSSILIWCVEVTITFLCFRFENKKKHLVLVLKKHKTMFWLKTQTIMFRLENVKSFL
jgi:hypothetical protein